MERSGHHYFVCRGFFSGFKKCLQLDLWDSGHVCPYDSIDVGHSMVQKGEGQESQCVVNPNTLFGETEFTFHLDLNLTTAFRLCLAR